MYCLMPRHIPTFSVLLDDIVCRSDENLKTLAKALDVDESTLRRWRKTDSAPKIALLSVFWMTSFGQNAVDTKTHNDALLYASYVEALKREIAHLKAHLAIAGRIGDFGSANSPTLEMSTVPPAQSLQLARVITTAAAADPATSAAPVDDWPVLEWPLLAQGGVRS